MRQQALVLAALLPLLGGASAAYAATVVLNPVADNTIYHGEIPADPTGTFTDNTCGAGPDVFAGVTLRGFIRRALLRFDIANAIPAGSSIDAVTLTLAVTQTTDTQDATMTLHRVLQDGLDVTVFDLIAKRGLFTIDGN